MIAWLELLLSNAALATLLALTVAVVSWLRPRPVVLHALWVIVLLKFVTPPLVRWELPNHRVFLTDNHRNEAPIALDSSLSDRDNASKRKSLTIQTAPTDSAEGTAHGRHQYVTTPTDSDSDAALSDHNTIESYIRPLDTIDDGGRSPGTEASVMDLSLRPFVALTSWAPAYLPKVIAGIWASGSIAWFALAGVRLWRFHRCIDRSQPADEATKAVVAQVAGKIGLHTHPLVRLTDAALPPMLVTFRLRQVVLLPRNLLRDLPSCQQAAIIAHELAHLHHPCEAVIAS